MRMFLRRLLDPFLVTRGAALMARLEDRQILERVIFPHISAHHEFRDILWVGCDWYTAAYPALFRDRNFWTLDIDPVKERYGSARHVIDGFENMRAEFGIEELDMVLCNGVLGWHLDAEQEIDKALRGCFESLRPGGVLMIGWNDLPRRRPRLLPELSSLEKFDPYVFPPLGTNELRTRSILRHVFSFYRKPDAYQ
jgi:SAM-dependent methyltransferase